MQAAKRCDSLSAGLLLLIVGAALLLTARIEMPKVQLPLPSVVPGATVLLAVGDIGSCESTDDEDVAALAAQLPGAIALLGDNVYPEWIGLGLQ